MTRNYIIILAAITAIVAIFVACFAYTRNASVNAATLNDSNFDNDQYYTLQAWKVIVSYITGTTIDLSGAATVGSLSTTGSATVGSLSTTGSATVGSLVGGSLDVLGDTTITGVTTITGDTTITGQAEVGSLLTNGVGNTGNAEVGGALDVTGNAEVGGALDVTGNAQVGGALDVTGNAQVGGALDVTGDADVGGALDVTGNADVGGSLKIMGGLYSGFRNYGVNVITASITPSGHASVTSLNQGSDDRLKHNETPIINGLDVINKLNPLSYIKTHITYDSNHNFELSDNGVPTVNGNELSKSDWFFENGIIAQEIEQIDELKHVVSDSTRQDENGNIIKTVKYNDIFVYNVAAVQELHKLHQEDNAKIAELTTNYNALLARVAALENA